MKLNTTVEFFSSSSPKEVNFSLFRLKKKKLSDSYVISRSLLVLLTTRFMYIAGHREKFVLQTKNFFGKLTTRYYKSEKFEKRVFLFAHTPGNRFAKLKNKKKKTNGS